MPRGQQDGKSSAETARIELCRLPIEVLSTIASFCTKIDLCALTRTCQLLCGISLKALYHTLVVDADLFIRLIRLGEGFKHASLRGISWLEQVRCLYAFLDHTDFDYTYAMKKIEKMKYLRQMLVVYDVRDLQEDFGRVIPYYLPSTFSETLTKCVIGLAPNDEEERKLVQLSPVAKLLFKLPVLRTLHVYGAKFSTSRIAGIDDQSSSIEELKLINCYFPTQVLYRILCIPRALQYLTIIDDTGGFYADDEDSDTDFKGGDHNNLGYFQEIGNSASASTLKGLKFFYCDADGVLGPEPGLQQLRNLLYLDVSPKYFVTPGKSGESSIPRCGLEQLLPPDLEVLKISPQASDFPSFYEIVNRKSELAPRLRKIVFSILYRTREMQAKLVSYDTTVESLESDLEENDYIRDNARRFPVSDEKHTFPEFRALCEKNSVELVLLYEDSTQLSLFSVDGGYSIFEIGENEGGVRGRAVWDIPDQIS